MSFAFLKISCRLLNPAVIPLQNISFCRESLKAANSCILHEYSSGYCALCAAYLVRSWNNSWTMLFPCLIVLNLLDACLCVNVFRKHFCNPLITSSRDQFLIGWSCLLTFLVYHSSVSPLSLIPKYSTWNVVQSSPIGHSFSAITVFLW